MPDGNFATNVKESASLFHFRHCLKRLKIQCPRLPSPPGAVRRDRAGVISSLSLHAPFHLGVK